MYVISPTVVRKWGWDLYMDGIPGRTYIINEGGEVLSWARAACGARWLSGRSCFAVVPGRMGVSAYV